MFRKLILISSFVFLFAIPQSQAQSTNGLVTGVVTDPSGAIIIGAQIDVKSEGTGLLRSTTSGSDGVYIVPQLPPGIYGISIKKQGFATENRTGVQLHVNQNATLDFKLTVSSTAQTIEVTGAPPSLNTTSATLSDVVGHDAVVQLPLNGRQFTQLALLTPGVVPQEGGQQRSFIVSLGAGGIVPAVNGQRPQQNNFTMDGVLNNNVYLNSWTISPPPDALEEFNVQSHITDAQFSISSGANINLVTRSGTNTLHGAAWEFIRNDALDAQTFPSTKRLPYRQNQYGLYLGGPVTIPHLMHGRDNTWFSVYWEGFRSSQSLSHFGNTFTTAMQKGDFSALLGPQVGTDSLGRPEFKNEIYDPATSRPDPNHPGAILRDPFPGNIIPTDRISPAAPIILQKYYPAPNLNVAPTVLPNFLFSGVNATASDQAGIRIDHRFHNNDTVFGRYNRSNINFTTPEPLPGYIHDLGNYAQTVAVGYTHLFGSSTILNLHYAYTQTNVTPVDEPAGAAFNSSINFSGANPPESNPRSLGPQIGISNGYSGINQTDFFLGPQNGHDYHADLSKVVGNHTMSFGGMYYRIIAYNGAAHYSVNFTQNATSQGATASSTGLGPASFLLGLPDNLGASLGAIAVNQTVGWYGGYAQDQWQATKKLAITVGLRYDYIAPANYHTIFSGLDVLTGQFVITAPYLPLFPKATGPSGYYYPQYNGFQPRFGIAYQASPRTVLRGAFAIFDDHNNTLVQENQDIHHSWPFSATSSVTNQNRAKPNLFITNLPDPSIYLNPLVPYASFGANPHNKIPYSMEFNGGIEQQLTNSLVLNVDYVGSLGRHQFIQPTANTAPIPGPGTLASRGQPFPQYGGPFSFDMNSGQSSYNALQAKLKKSLSSGLFFLASYTWSKSLDIESSGQDGSIQNFYDTSQDWGPSSFNRSHMLVLSGVYALPLGRGKSILSNPNRVVQAIAGNWNVSSIVSLIAGAPFNATAGGDVANVGGGSQRAQKIANPYSVPGFTQGNKQWINKAAFAIPAQYTFGNERRNDLLGPPYKDVDFNAFKDFALPESATLQFRAEFFNIFNHTNYGNPTTNVQSSSFGQILSANGSGREIQFAVKLLF
ncbi:MAG: TonB-dependent receptor [Edaphobacter sp.]